MAENEYDDTASSAPPYEDEVAFQERRKIFLKGAFNVKKADCSTNGLPNPYNITEDNLTRGSRNDAGAESSDDGSPKKRTRRIALSIRADRAVDSEDSIVGSHTVHTSESFDSTEFKIKKKRLTAPAYRKLLRRQM